MEVISRDYLRKEFVYNGKLSKDKGANPELTIGFAIQDSETEAPTIDVVHDFRYNNYDASVIFIVNVLTKVNFYLAKPTVDEMWKEIKLQSVDFFKLLRMECTSIKKNIMPPSVDIEGMKDKLQPVIKKEIDELY
jgi:hypothetical protein